MRLWKLSGAAGRASLCRAGRTIGLDLPLRGVAGSLIGNLRCRSLPRGRSLVQTKTG